MLASGTFGRKVSAPLALLLLTLAILWPAFVNGDGFIFSDTTAYVRGADAAVVRLTGRRSPWSDRLFDRYPQATVAARAARPAAGAAAPAAVETPIVLSGRSIYYGALLYLSLLVDSLWLIAILQAALAAAALLLTMRRFAAPPLASNSVATLAALGLIALLTPLGYYAAFAMPDIFAPLAILAGGHIAFAWRSMARGERLFWTALLAAGAVFHTATLLITIGLALLALIVRALLPVYRREGRNWPFLLAICLAVAGELVFAAAIRHATGFPPVRPPFLTARLIQDGPGLRYLRRHCTDPRPFLVCRYRDRLPLPSDAFLWSSGPRDGLFKVLTPGDQRLLAAQETRFSAAVLADEPASVTALAGRNSIEQAMAVALADFNPGRDALASLNAAVPQPLRGRLAATAAFQNNMPVKVATMLALPLAIASLLVIAAVALLNRRRDPDDEDRRRLLLAGWIIAGVALNAIVCGALSGPHDRYGARVIWLLPVAALMVVSRRRAAAAALTAKA